MYVCIYSSIKTKLLSVLSLSSYRNPGGRGGGSLVNKPDSKELIYPSNVFRHIKIRCKSHSR